MKPLYTISKSASAGNQENCKCVARIFNDEIIVVTPCLKYCRCNLIFALIENIILDKMLVAAVLQDMACSAIDSAWRRIGDYLEDDYTAA